MPGFVDQNYVMDLESRMRVIQVNLFKNLSARENLWWDKITKVQTSGSRREIFFWILETASIEPQGKGGNVQYDDMQVIETEYVNLDAGKGLKLRKNQFSDLDGNGVKIAEAWVKQQTSLAAYWPQQLAAQQVLSGETGLGYDKVAFFSASHPNNGIDTSNGTYANIFTGGASGGYPGACPIDASVTLDVAFTNLSKVIAYIKSLKMPNGKNPRMLRPKFLLVPPALQTRAVLLTKAKEFALAASGGAGSADVQGVISSWGLGDPVIADEFATNITGTTADDTTYYVGCESMLDDELGSLVYIDREPFGINYYSGDNGANFELGRSNELAWLTHGRNVSGFGHPYSFFKCKGS